jgi:hypothetical protein
VKTLWFRLERKATGRGVTVLELVATATIEGAGMHPEQLAEMLELVPVGDRVRIAIVLGADDRAGPARARAGPGAGDGARAGEAPRGGARAGDAAAPEEGT